MSLAAGMAIGGAAVSVVGGLIGGSKAASAAADQAEQQSKATHARWQYDLDAWDMKKSQLQAQRQEAVDRIMAEARNEGKVRAYKDAAAQDQYDYALKIRNAQQTSNEMAFKRSDDIFQDQVTLNNMAAKSAMDSEIVRLEESKTEARFDRNETYLEMIQAEGALRARSASGRSAVKGMQATMADYGRQMEMLNASLDSNERNAYSALQEIIRDKSSADLTAFASKMLDPGVLPEPIKQRPIPVAEYTLPRILVESDFGPQPVRGFMASPGAAADAVWGQTISSVAGAVGGAMMSYGMANVGGSGLGGGGDFVNTAPSGQQYGPMASDIALKENINQVGVSPSGLNIYEWNYIGETDRYRGVIAQDLIAKGRRDVVTEADNGYLAVYYDRIDVNMEHV